MSRKSTKPSRIEEDILFDANRDNDGKGVSPIEIIKLLKKIRRA